MISFVIYFKSRQCWLAVKTVVLNSTNALRKSRRPNTTFVVAHVLLNLTTVYILKGRYKVSVPFAKR